MFLLGVVVGVRVRVRGFGTRFSSVPLSQETGTCENSDMSQDSDGYGTSITHRKIGVCVCVFSSHLFWRQCL